MSECVCVVIWFSLQQELSIFTKLTYIHTCIHAYIHTYRRVVIWSIVQQELSILITLPPPEGVTGAVTRAVCCGSGVCIAVGHAGGNMCVWDVRDGIHETLPLPTGEGVKPPVCVCVCVYVYDVWHT